MPHIRRRSRYRQPLVSRKASAHGLVKYINAVKHKLFRLLTHDLIRKHSRVYCMAASMKASTSSSQISMPWHVKANLRCASSCVLPNLGNNFPLLSPPFVLRYVPMTSNGLVL